LEKYRPPFSLNTGFYDCDLANLGNSPQISQPERWRTLMNIPDAFLSGKLVDENGLPPNSANFTVVTEGEFHGQHGFERIQGDHRCDPDGTFTSPPLRPGRYFLRFFGILRAPALEADNGFKQQQERVFDFIYPNVATVTEALPFEVQPGKTVSVDVQVSKPVWFNIAGRVKLGSPIEQRNVHVMFARNMGIFPDVGGTGFTAKPDGSFEGMLLGGSYLASLHEMTNPEPSGYTRSVKQFGSTAVIIQRDTLNLELLMQ
jgi:hypothetical protein